MTFLTTFFKFLFLLLLIGFVGVFGTREVLLYMAGQQLVSDVRFITQSSRWDQLVSLCEGGVITETPFDGFQVRFTSADEYSIETHCLSTIPGVYKTKKLPYQVKKTTGSAGFFYDFTSKNLMGEVTLELWGQKRLVYAEGSRPGQTWGKTLLQAGVPASVCAAHGRSCCDPVLEIGVGDVNQDGVTDCSAQCYSSCQKRPLLLSFQSDPQVKYESRQILVPETEASVIFSYLFEDVQSPVQKVVLDYGDGTQEEVTKRSGQVTKEYTCGAPPCTFNATITGIDAREIPSAQTRLSQIQVILGAPAAAETP